MPGMPPKKTKTSKKELTATIPEPEMVVEPVIQVEETFTFKRSHFYAFVTVFAFAAGVLLGYVTWGYGSTVPTSSGPPPNAAIGANVPTEEPQYVRYDVDTEGYPTIGSEDADITIVEFSDYQCPYCKRWHQEVYEPLFAAYPGQIRLVYRHLPLTTIHPDAFSAAEAAMCAGDQNAYWQYHDMLFTGTLLGTDIYTQYAQDLGLDMTVFESCITEHKYQSAIETDSDFALNMGVRSTPTFFINGLAVVGAQPLDVFQQVIDKELAGEIPQ